MKQLSLPYKYLIIVIGLIIHISATAQEPIASFRSLPDSVIRNPIFISELDHQYLFFETGYPGSINICSLNSEMQLIRKMPLPNSFIRNKYDVLKTDSSISFVSHFRMGDTLYIQLVRLNSALDIVEDRLNAFRLPDKRRSGYTMVMDQKQQHFFMYHIWTFSEDSAFIYGIKTNRALEAEQEVAYVFPYRNELDTLGNLMMDTKGNIHLLIYDKPYSYKLSSSLNIHSIPADKDELVTESFTFQKKKIFGLMPLEDTMANLIRLQGFFLEGQTKNKEGVLHIEMPLERGQGLDFRLYPFLKMNLIGPEKMSKRNPYRNLNQFKLGFYLDEENKTRLIAELPAWDFGSADTTGAYQRSLGRLQMGENTVQSFEAPRRFSDVVASATQANNPGRSTRQARVAPIQSSYSNPSAFSANSMSYIDPKMLGYIKFRATTSRAPKMFSFNLNDKAEWVGYQQKALDEFYNETYNMRLPVQLAGKFYVLAYGGDKQDNPIPILVSYENEKPVVLKISKGYAVEGIVFTQFQKINTNKYLGIYRTMFSPRKGVFILESINAPASAIQH